MPAKVRSARPRAALVSLFAFVAVLAMVATSCASTPTITITSAGEASAAAAENSRGARSSEAAAAIGDSADGTSPIAADSGPAFEATPTFLAYAAEQVSQETTYRMEVFQNLDAGSLMSFGSLEEPFIIGEVSGSLAAINLDMGSMLGDMAIPGFETSGDMSMYMVIDDTTMYLNAPVFEALIGADPNLNVPVMDTIIDGWGRIDVSQLTDSELEESLDSFTMGNQLDSTAILDMLESVGEVLDGGRDEVRGVPTNRVYTSVNFQDLMDDGASNAMGGLGTDFPGLSDLPPVSVEVHIDDNDLVRRIEYNIDMGAMFGDTSGEFEMTMWQRIDFFDFGGDVNIAVPVGAADITNEFLELAELGG